MFSTTLLCATTICLWASPDASTPSTAPRLNPLPNLSLVTHPTRSLAMQELAHKLAMQVVGAGPKYLDRSAVPSEALQAEAAVLREQALKSGGWLWEAGWAAACAAMAAALAQPARQPSYLLTPVLLSPMLLLLPHHCCASVRLLHCRCNSHIGDRCRFSVVIPPLLLPALQASPRRLWTRLWLGGSTSSTARYASWNSPSSWTTTIRWGAPGGLFGQCWCNGLSPWALARPWVRPTVAWSHCGRLGLQQVTLTQLMVLHCSAPSALAAAASSYGLASAASACRAQLQTCPALAALALCVASNSMAHAASHRSSQVQDILKQNSKQLGTNLSISGFVRVQVWLFLGCSNPHRSVAPASFAFGCCVQSAVRSFF